MSGRQKPPARVEQALWGQSMGHCMNPECGEQFISDDMRTNLADKAHIIPDSKGGDPTLENLILLCKNCHAKTEPLERPEMAKTLRQWKTDQKAFIAKLYAKKFANFRELYLAARPLLEENHMIFSEYGPHTNDPKAFLLWKEFEHKLLANNARLKAMFQQNLDLFEGSGDYNNRRAILYFIRHVDEFAATRDGDVEGIRMSLFPWRVLSIFRIEPETKFGRNSVNIIESLIRVLQSQGHKVNFDILAGPKISYGKKGQEKFIHADDTPLIDQILFSAGEKPVYDTKMSIIDLRVALLRLRKVGVYWSFTDLPSLTIITLNKSLRVKFMHEYTLSEAELMMTDLSSVSHIVNINVWGSACVTGDAIEYAKSKGVFAMHFPEFSEFCKPK